MIVTKNIEIKINIKNIQHFQNLGYKNLKIKDTINIPVEHLMTGSKSLISVKCDICGGEKEITYKLYNYCIKKHNLYTCVGSCTDIKRSKTSLQIFGKTHWMKCEYNYEKYKGIIINKYGVDNVFKSKSAQDKFKKTILERYGVSSLSHSDEIYQKQQISGFSMKKHRETGLYYRGTYELDFLNYCHNNNVKIEQGKRFSYKIEDSQHYYFSDYYYEESKTVVEIKSSYYWNRYKDINILKMNSVLDSGYKFLLILDKNYSEFNKIICNSTDIN